jgi:hypothetical protein
MADRFKPQTSPSTSLCVLRLLRGAAGGVASRLRGFPVEAASDGGFVLGPDMTPYGLCLKAQLERSPESEEEFTELAKQLGKALATLQDLSNTVEGAT